MEQDFLTIPEVATLLRIAERTTYKLAREGKLVGAAKVANQWRINREELLAWLKAGGEAPVARDDEGDE